MKTNELSGALLDYWVARAWCFNTPIGRVFNRKNEFVRVEVDDAPYSPSTNWSQGGPIIEREKINTSFCDEDWFAQLAGTGPRDDSPNYLSAGRTPLEAAMRCYVASKATPEQIAEWVKETRG